MGRDKRPLTKWPREIERRIAAIPGAVDVHLHQVMDYPELRVNVDRDARRPDRPDAARRGQQPAHLAELERPGGAQLLAEPGQRRQLQRRRADAAVPHRLLRRAGADADRRRLAARSAAAAGQPRRLSSAAARWRSSTTTTCSRCSTCSPTSRAATSGRVARDVDRHRRRDRSASCPGASSSTCAGRWRPWNRPSRGLGLGPDLRRGPGLPADGGQLPVLARSVHHHDGAAGRAGRHRLDALRHPDHAERARP